MTLSVSLRASRLHLAPANSPGKIGLKSFVSIFLRALLHRFFVSPCFSTTSALFPQKHRGGPLNASSGGYVLITERYRRALL